MQEQSPGQGPCPVESHVTAQLLLARQVPPLPQAAPDVVTQAPFWHAAHVPQSTSAQHCAVQTQLPPWHA
jgi:hypothetical protein